MISVNFSNSEVTIKNRKVSPPERKDIKGEDGNTYQVVVPRSAKTTVLFSYTHKGVLKKNELPDEIKDNFSDTDFDLILEKQKNAIQKVLTRNMKACVKQIDFILDYKDFIEGGQDTEMLTNKVKELQSALKKI